MKVLGLVRRFFGAGKLGNGNGDQQLGLGFLGEQGVSFLQAPKALRAAAGVRFVASMGSATLLAPVTAWPTTTATMGLYNDSDDRSLFVDTLGYHLGSGTPTASSALVACVVGGIQTRPTISTGANGGYAGTEIMGLNGTSTKSKAIFATNLTLLKVGSGNPAWHVVAGNPSGVGLASATLAAHAAVVAVEGGIVVPPRGILGLAVLSGTGTTPLFGFQVTWDEYQADLE